MKLIDAGLAMTCLLTVSALYASPPPGTYELYNGEGKKTGVITSSVKSTPSDGKTISNLETVTKIEIPEVVDTYRFTETDSAEIHPEGLVSFRRESDTNGKKELYLGTRRGRELVINYEKDGRKFSTSISTSTFDLTDFEMDLPGSRFRALLPGQSKTLRVFFLDRLDVVPVARNVSAIQKFPYNENTVPVLVVTTLIKGKVITSWFHAKTGDLLQEEGTDYLMSRVE